MRTDTGYCGAKDAAANTGAAVRAAGRRTAAQGKGRCTDADRQVGRAARRVGNNGGGNRRTGCCAAG